MTSTRFSISSLFGVNYVRPTRLGLGFFAVFWLAAVSFAHRAALGFLPDVGATDPIEAFFFETNVSVPWLHYALFALVVFHRRHHLLTALSAPASPLIGALVSGLGLLVLGWARYTEQTDLEIDSLVWILAGSALLAGGIRFLDRMVLPLALLWLARPWPPMITHHLHASLQSWTAAFAQTVLDPFSNVIRSGFLLAFENRVFEVIEGCSGLRLQITLFTATLVYLDFVSRSRRQTLGVLLAALLIGPFLNGLRVVSIMLNPMAEVSQVHSAQGLVFISLGVVVVAAIDRLLEPWFWPEYDPAWKGPAKTREGPRDASLDRLLGPAAVAVAALTVAGYPYDRPRHLESAHWGLHEFRSEMGDWRRTDALELDRQFMGTIQFRNKLYWKFTRQSDGQNATLLVGTDDRRRRDQSALSPRIERLGAGWVILESVPIELEEPLGTAVRTIQQRGPDRALVLHYQIGEGSFASEILRWLMAVDLWPGFVPDEIVTVRISTPIDPAQPARALAALSDLQHEVHDALRRADPHPPRQPPPRQR